MAAGDTVTIGGQTKHVVGYMKDFLFSPEQARTPVGVLSGGERNRLMLARALAQPSNLLVLDEPTNDLDLETLDLLQEMITDYSGTVILVSHDRDFLDRTVELRPGVGGRWALDRVCGRIHRHGGPARAGRSGADRSISMTSRKVSTRSQPSAGRSFQAQDEFQRAARPQDVAGANGGHRGEDRAAPGNHGRPALYARDPERFQKASAALAVQQAELAAAEDRWLELEMLKEELGG